MVGEQKLEVEFACFLDFGAVGLYDHAVGDGVNAGGHHAGGLAALGNLDKANPACANFVYITQIAEGGNIDVGGTGGVRHRHACRHFVISAVYCNFYFIHVTDAALLS